MFILVGGGGQNSKTVVVVVVAVVCPNPILNLPHDNYIQLSFVETKKH